MLKRIGVLTSGGDCAGLNATIRSVYLHASNTYGLEVIGIRNGTTGLITRPLDYTVLNKEICSTAMLRSGGTILGSTNRSNPFNFTAPDGSQSDRSHDLIEGYNQLKLDALIAIGGDGSLRILDRLSKIGNLNLVAIPKTIDNDLGHTELAIGFSTALDIATEALDRLQPTAASHNRVMILEVMGRDAGHIALGAGIAGGADVIIIPEIPYKIDEICKKINTIIESGRNYALIVVAESVKKEDGTAATIESAANDRPRYGGIGQYICDKISSQITSETRVTVLGHVQRGSQPNALDRVIGAAFGVKAVDLVMEKKYNRMVAWRNRKVVDVSIEDAIKDYRAVPPDDVLVKIARGMGTYIGNP